MALKSYRKTTDLPDVIPVFPLAGAMLFPRWTLPLNIFEPRYLNMVDDAMAGSRLIGMIQPRNEDRQHPPLMSVGCAGRITSYAETDDGRYQIVLTGICRYALNEELQMDTPYRQVRPDWTAFENDLLSPDETQLPGRKAILDALRNYAQAKAFETDWDAAERAPLETLISALCAGCPFSPAEQQALLEAPDLSARADTLVTLLEIDRTADDEGPLQ